MCLSRFILFTSFILLFLLGSCSPTATTEITPASTSVPAVATSTASPTVATPIQSTPAVAEPLVVLSLLEGRNAHLFAYSSRSSAFTRLTTDPWDDITPALSPDGSWLAYSSRRNGYWDLYLLDLNSGTVNRLTDTLEYEANPSWSPDGLWLVYEKYVNDNLNLAILSVSDPAQPSIPLTESPFADRSPAWQPMGGRQVAFISNRSGEDEVWIANLDLTGDDRFINISRNTGAIESNPVWSPNGEILAWASSSSATGLSSILLWDTRQPGTPPRSLCAGDWAVWLTPDQLLVRFSAPDQTYFTRYEASSGAVLQSLVELPGVLNGLTAGESSLYASFLELMRPASAQTPAPLYFPLTVTPAGDLPSGRTQLIVIPDIQAPYPRLHDEVDEAFAALRLRVAFETGWDALASLENALVPLTTPLDPGLGEDWLLSGRAFILNPLLLNAGVVAAVPENIGPQTYWRVYLRARTQDGSMGEPLHQVPWDFNARYSGDPSAYDRGGLAMTTIPAGYWVDLTALANAYGWERLPALSNWRTYFNGARIGEFVMTSGLDWHSAMLEIYPPEALVTPTVVIPPTRTPTRTPWGYQSPTPSATPTPRPTLTPKP